MSAGAPGGKKCFKDLLRFIYGEKTAESVLPRFMELLERAGPIPPPAEGRPGAGPPITQGDAFLISYGDMLAPGEKAPPDEPALARLGRFLERRNPGVFTYLHILPFHPYSSDDGFSVIDYREVDQRLGTWEDIEVLGKPPGRETAAGRAGGLKLAFDFVINHGSVQSRWFKGFLAGEEPYRDWYITRPADYDYRSVVRPRTHPLLTAFERGPGKDKVYVWTTFSADQVDYDFSNPRVLLEFAGILLEYIRRGAGIVRLDAIAYLWKEDGHRCLHHPKTHAVVRLFRAMVDYLGSPLLILTETNVPHGENISYFGGPLGDNALDDLPEAHMVYNFALPPLVLHAAVSGDAAPLRNWAGTLPVSPRGEGGSGAGNRRYFLNFLASHDGVGLGPARGLVDEDVLNATIEEVRRRGALVSHKSTPAGDIPYELNCSYASIVAPGGAPWAAGPGGTELRARAFLAVHGVLLSLSGLPAVYFHSWIGSGAWVEGPGILGYRRAINREKPPMEKVEEELEDPGTFRFHVYRGINRLLAFRQSRGIFDPEAPQRVLEPGTRPGNNSLFILFRGPDKDGHWALCAENLAPERTVWKPGDSLPLEYARHVPPEVPLEAWETLWLVFDGNGGVSRLSTA